MNAPGSGQAGRRTPSGAPGVARLLRRGIVLALLLVPAPALAIGLPRGYPVSEYETAIADARKSGKPVMIYFTQHNCRYCRIVEGYLSGESLQSAYVRNYHFVVVDVTRNVRGEAFQQQLMKRFRYRATPMFAFLTPEGRHLCTSYGGFNHPEDGLALHRYVQANKSAPLARDNPPGHPCGRGDA